jgi:DNA-binding CsgD family transcriptional regulator
MPSCATMLTAKTCLRDSAEVTVTDPNRAKVSRPKVIEVRKPQRTPTPAPDVGDLVRTIVQRVAPQRLPDGQTQQILLDTTIEESRYLLVRLPNKDRRDHTLSPREAEIVRMVSHGYPNKVIAGVLNISSWTVSTHLRRIFAKLNVTSRAEMVAHTFEVHSSRD